MGMGITRGFGVDIGGSGVKGGLVDLEAGALDGERLRIPTPQPSTPDAVADVVAEIVEKFDWAGPVGVTLPCVVKHGVALSAANVDKGWIGTDAAAAVRQATRPPRGGHRRAERRRRGRHRRDAVRRRRRPRRASWCC